jgi:hypothetical protein
LRFRAAITRARPRLLRGAATGPWLLPAGGRDDNGTAQGNGNGLKPGFVYNGAEFSNLAGGQRTGLAPTAATSTCS